MENGKPVSLLNINALIFQACLYDAIMHHAVTLITNPSKHWTKQDVWCWLEMSCIALVIGEQDCKLNDIFMSSLLILFHPFN